MHIIYHLETSNDVKFQLYIAKCLSIFSSFAEFFDDFTTRDVKDLKRKGSTKYFISIWIEVNLPNVKLISFLDILVKCESALWMQIIYLQGIV